MTSKRDYWLAFAFSAPAVILYFSLLQLSQGKASILVFYVVLTGVGLEILASAALIFVRRSLIYMLPISASTVVFVRIIQLVS